MKLLPITIATVFAITAPAFSVQEKNSGRTTQIPPMRLTLSSTSSRFEMGEAVIVRVELQNLAFFNGVLVGLERESMDGWPYNLNITVVDSNGTPVPPPTGMRMHESGPGVEWVELRTGSFYGQYLYLLPKRETFMEKPGKYFVKATYQGVKPSSQAECLVSRTITPVFDGKLESNTLSFDIVEKK